MKKFVDKKLSFQARIDKGLQYVLKNVAKSRHMTLKTLVEGYIIDGLDKDNAFQLWNKKTSAKSNCFRKD